MNQLKERYNGYTLTQIRNLCRTFGYGETKVSKMFQISLRESREIVKGINLKDVKYESKHLELNPLMLPYATHYVDITYPFHDGSIQKRHNARTVLPSIDGFYLMETTIRSKKDMSIKRHRTKTKDLSYEYETLLSILLTIPKGSKVVFDRYYKDLKKLEDYGITPIIVSKSREYKRLIKEFDKEYIKKVKRIYNSEAESCFANVAKRIYRVMDLFTQFVKVKKRKVRICLLTYEEQKMLHEALCEMEDNNKPQKIMVVMDYLKTIKENRQIEKVEIKMINKKKKKIKVKLKKTK